MAWIILFIAGLMEIGWAIGLKYTEGFTRLVPSVLTLAAMAASVLLLGLALKTLPIGTQPDDMMQITKDKKAAAWPLHCAGIAAMAATRAGPSSRAETGRGRPLL